MIHLQVEVIGNSITPGDPRIQVLRGLAQRLQALDGFQAYGQGLADQQVEIALADAQVMQRWTWRPDILGCHVITAGRFANQYYIDRHLCLVNMSASLLTRLLEEDCWQGALSPQDSIASWLLTLPHEVAHIAEFIRAGRGLSPQALFLQSGRDHAAVQAAAGWEDELPVEADETSALECRIERLAQQWYQQIRPSSAELDRIIAHFGAGN